MEPIDPDEVRRFAQKLFRHTAYRLKRRTEFANEDVEDIEQDFCVKVECTLDSLDASRNWRGLIARLIKHYARNQLRNRNAQKRAGRPTSIHVPVPCEGDGPTELSQTISQDEHNARHGPVSRSDQEFVDLRLDVREFIERLPPDEAALAEQLMSQTIAEITRETGVPRGAINRDISRLRKRFENTGLKKYLENPRHPRREPGNNK